MTFSEQLYRNYLEANDIILFEVFDEIASKFASILDDACNLDFEELDFNCTSLEEWLLINAIYVHADAIVEVTNIEGLEWTVSILEDLPTMETINAISEVMDKLGFIWLNKLEEINSIQE